MYMLGMFDMPNMAKLSDLLEEGARMEIQNRLLSVDNILYANLFK